MTRLTRVHDYTFILRLHNYMFSIRLTFTCFIHVEKSETPTPLKVKLFNQLTMQKRKLKEVGIMQKDISCEMIKP